MLRREVLPSSPSLALVGAVALIFSACVLGMLVYLVVRGLERATGDVTRVGAALVVGVPVIGTGSNVVIPPVPAVSDFGIQPAVIRPRWHP